MKIGYRYGYALSKSWGRGWHSSCYHTNSYYCHWNNDAFWIIWYKLAIYYRKCFRNSHLSRKRRKYAKSKLNRQFRRKWRETIYLAKKHEEFDDIWPNRVYCDDSWDTDY